MRSMLFLRCAITLLGAMHLAQASAIPVPATNSTEVLAQADTVFVGRVTARSIDVDSDRQAVTIRTERVLKSARSIEPGALVHLQAIGHADPDMASGQRALFVLRCGGPASLEPCRAVDAHRPGWPAVDTVPASPRPADESGVERAVIAELVAVVTAGDTTLAASTWSASATPVEAIWTRLDAIRALDTLPPAAVRTALQASGTPSSVPARLAWLTARAQARDYADLARAGDLMLDDDPGLELAREGLTTAMMGNPHPPESLVPSMTSWLRSRDPSVRRTAAYVVRNIATPSIIRPLLQLGITDTEQEVRYYACTGLAAATHENRQYVATALYRADEGRYLSYWRARRAALEAAR